MFAKLSIVASLLLLFCGNFADAQEHDLAILGGRVIDPETMLDDVLNVAVNDGKITTITKEAIQGKTTIDASGHVVAPGFVDTHNHVVPTPFGQKLALRDGVTFENATQRDLYRALSHPTSIIGSDAFPALSKKDGSFARDWDTPYDSVNAHPRAAGTHARILKLVREENLMPLMLAISKMTFMPARFLQENGVEQMARKGRIQLGMDADITIFDPKTVADQATPQNGGLPSVGIPHVIVNGTVVVQDSKVLEGVFPGQPIRNDVLD